MSYQLIKLIHTWTNIQCLISVKISAVASGTEIADQGFRDDPIDVDGEGKFIVAEIP